ncbi:MAG: PIN domain-containing protein [Shimia sp.]
MIVLDTDIVFELMRPDPAPEVMAWFYALGPVPLALAAVTVGEVREAIGAMRDAARRGELEAAFDALLAERFPDRVLPFDGPAAAAYGRIMAARRPMGVGSAPLSVMVAATASAHGAALATGQPGEAEGAEGLIVHDPFAGTGGQGDE